MKLLTLRSVWITTIATTVLAPLFAGLIAPQYADGFRSNDPDLTSDASPALIGLEWIGLGIFGVIIIGIMAGTGEYASRQLKTSLMAVPNRARLVLAKAFALFLLTLGMALIAVPAITLFSQFMIGDLSAIQNGIPEAMLWRMAGGILFWVAAAQISFAFALLMRQTLIPLVVLFVLSQMSLLLTNLIPFAKYSPFSAGAQLYDGSMVTGSTPSAGMTPLIAATVLLAWVVVLLIPALIRFTRGDTKS